MEKDETIFSYKIKNLLFTYLLSKVQCHLSFSLLLLKTELIVVKICTIHMLRNNPELIEIEDNFWESIVQAKCKYNKSR